tara:strand:- start:1990 stop:3000 length:1011 start_codon:yes stop_codon:yes gene_type:complete
MANGQQTSRYPVMGGPQLSSIIARQRMALDDAMYATEKQKERQFGLAKAGGKGIVEYDKMLRGFMEAKYANPQLKFWDYVSKPSVGSAFRKQGRDLIAQDAKAGRDVKGMDFFSRQKAGLKGVFGKDEIPQTLEQAEAGAKKAAGMGKSGVEIIGDDVADVGSAYAQKAEYGAKEVAGMVKGDVTKDALDPSLQALQDRLTSSTSNLEQAEIGLDKAFAKAAGKGATEEVSKAGLKEVLGTGAKGATYGLSLASGIKDISKGKTAEKRTGGALKAAGGAAGLVAMTNFWNPVGWAAAVPAALSIAGQGLGMMGGRGNDPLSKTPLGRYRRRVGIGV